MKIDGNGEAVPSNPPDMMALSDPPEDSRKQNGPMPHNKEMEMATLGACIINADVVPIVQEMLTPDSFYVLSHQKLFRIICELYEENDDVDIVAARNEAVSRGLVDKAKANWWIQNFTESFGTSSGVEYYAGQVKDSEQRRKMLRAGHHIIQQADGGDVDSSLEEAREMLSEIQSEDQQEDASAYEAWCEALERMNSDDKLNMPRFGVDAIDRMLDMEGGDLLIIGGESGAGKSSALYHLLWNACRRQKKSAFLFSAEILKHKVMRRMMCQACSVRTDHAKALKINDEEWERMERKFHDKPIKELDLTINDKLTDVDRITSKAITMSKRKHYDVIAIDHAQELNVNRSKGGNSDRDAVAVAECAKKIARETESLVVLLSQVTELDGGGWRLRGGDELRHEADLVFVLRNPNNVKFGEEADEDRTHRWVVLAKGRDAGQRAEKVPFYGPYLQFGGRFDS